MACDRWTAWSYHQNIKTLKKKNHTHILCYNEYILSPAIVRAAVSRNAVLEVKLKYWRQATPVH